jgi:hypothetical protein
MSNQIKTNITDVKIGEWVLVPGNQNNFFQVSNIELEKCGQTLLEGKSPEGRVVSYRGASYFSVRVVAELVIA